MRMWFLFLFYAISAFFIMNGAISFLMGNPYAYEWPKGYVDGLLMVWGLACAILAFMMGIASLDKTPPTDISKNP